MQKLNAVEITYAVFMLQNSQGIVSVHWLRHKRIFSHHHIPLVCCNIIVIACKLVHNS